MDASVVAKVMKAGNSTLPMGALAVVLVSGECWRTLTIIGLMIFMLG